jgi:hypothetical protein
MAKDRFCPRCQGPLKYYFDRVVPGKGVPGEAELRREDHSHGWLCEGPDCKYYEPPGVGDTPAGPGDEPH